VAFSMGLKEANTRYPEGTTWEMLNKGLGWPISAHTTEMIRRRKMTSYGLVWSSSRESASVLKLIYR